MRSRIVATVLVASIAAVSTACLPAVPTGLGSGSADVQFVSPSGDLAGLDLKGFHSAQANAQRLVGVDLDLTQLSFGNRDGTHALAVQIVGEPVAGQSCALRPFSAGLVSTQPGCGFLYTTGTGSALELLEGTFRVDAFDGARLAFTLEARLQAPAGGTVTVQAQGTARIFRRQTA